MHRSAEYARVIENLESRGVMPERAPSLEVTKKGMELIGFESFPFTQQLQKDLKLCILVAGTNGKGSVCSTLEALFSHAGERVGLYTSPHLIESTERIRIQGQDISQEHFCKAFEVVDQRTRSLKLTHFETVTLMALWYFASGELVKPVHRMILEVGLGGTWDSTNAVPHGAAVITRIGLDHQNILGRRLVDIAQNKFGVVTEKSLVIYAPLDPTLKDLARQKQISTSSKWVEVPSFNYNIIEQEGDPLYEIETPWGNSPLNLAGARGAENTSLALSLFKHLGFEPASHLKALEKVQWPGRMELVNHYRGPGRLYLSGDHNPQGIQSLLTLLPDFKFKTLRLLVGVGMDKDLEGILTPLFKLENTQVFLTETPFRGLKLENYGPWLNRASGHHQDPQEALQALLTQMQEGDLAVVTGSLYLVGLIKSLFP